VRNAEHLSAGAAEVYEPLSHDACKLLIPDGPKLRRAMRAKGLHRVSFLTLDHDVFSRFVSIVAFSSFMIYPLAAILIILRAGFPS
jgi:hypothetical protein